jgi:hypothetical protein
MRFNIKPFVFVLLIMTAAGFVFAQRDEVGTVNPQQLQYGVDNADLKEVSVEKFEVEGMWSSFISSDSGIVTSRLFDGGPSGKTAIPEEAGLDIPDTKVLGVRVDYLRRGDTSIFITPQRPIPVEGITKTVSLWVAGRNYNHTLVLLVKDYFDRYFELEIGKLNFQGWKKLTVAIPPQPDFGRQGIVQRNLHYANLGGLKIAGLRIDVDPAEAFGTYFVYFDDIRAITDLFSENSREPDDPSDDW